MDKTEIGSRLDRRERSEQGQRAGGSPPRHPGEREAVGRTCDSAEPSFAAPGGYYHDASYPPPGAPLSASAIRAPLDKTKQVRCLSLLTRCSSFISIELLAAHVKLGLPQLGGITRSLRHRKAKSLKEQLLCQSCCRFRLNMVGTLI